MAAARRVVSACLSSSASRVLCSSSNVITPICLSFAKLPLPTFQTVERDLRWLVVGEVRPPTVRIRRHPGLLALGALEDHGDALGAHSDDPKAPATVSLERALASQDSPSFDELVDLLRVRLGTADAINPSEVH